MDDNGEPVGVNDPDETMLKAMNAIRDSIKPDATMFVSCDIESLKGENVIAISVQRGTSRPYYLASKGIRPAGVYVRQGPASVLAPEETILKMIRETDGEAYEDVRSLEQALTFQAAETAFGKANIAFDREKMRTLQLLSEDGLYSNLGLLLSDQCPHSVKIAVFEGTEKTVFKDRHEFSGSLLRQLDDVFSYIERFNRTRAEFQGLKRIDTPDYPQEAIREALLNTLVHRDYALSGPALISLFDDRMEFVTLGGLVKGVSLEDIQLGISILRNRNLANIFYRLRLIEAYGTGIPKINASYSGSSVSPRIETTANAFKITLPNRNHIDTNEEEQPHVDLTDAEKAIVALLEEKRIIARREVEVTLGISQTMAIRILESLGAKGLIERVGAGKRTRYVPASPKRP